MSDLNRYNVLPPGQEQPVEAPPQVIQSSLPDTGNYTNLDAEAQLFYGGIQQNLIDTKELFQTQFDWEVKLLEQTIEEARKLEEANIEGRLDYELLFERLTNLLETITKQGHTPGYGGNF